jgi:hypothetical protein
MKQFNLETQAWEGEDDPPLTSLKYLQSIYRDENRPDNMRIRCAVEALPYENPKLGVTAHVSVDGSFAERLERALVRSAQSAVLLNPPAIEHEELVSANDMKRPFQSYRRF